MKAFDTTPCRLGEGAFWHPERDEFFWFDILSKRLHGPGGPWTFDTHASAGGWIDRDRMLVATATELLVLDLSTGARESLTPLEADNPATRSNDGRADPQGGFWIGTMGLNGEAGAGSIWRWWRGELRRLYGPVTVPNAICFTPDGRHAHFSDTAQAKVWRVALDEATGWPAGEPELWLDLSSEGLRPDGAVVAADGTFWNAQWGAGRVAVYDTSGREIAAHAFPAPQTTCPSFGGDGLRTLFVTTALDGLDAAALTEHPASGQTFAVETETEGQREHRVIL